MQQPTIENYESRKNSKANWFKKVGVLGFAFFFAKGMAWIAVTAWIID
jgi:hypothetical protein